eukprot:2671372-Rhodomonas_salina.1
MTPFPDAALPFPDASRLPLPEATLPVGVGDELREVMCALQVKEVALGFMPSYLPLVEKSRSAPSYFPTSFLPDVRY